MRFTDFVENFSSFVDHYLKYLDLNFDRDIELAYHDDNRVLYYSHSEFPLSEDFLLLEVRENTITITVFALLYEYARDGQPSFKHREDISRIANYDMSKLEGIFRTAAGTKKIRQPIEFNLELSPDYLLALQDVKGRVDLIDTFLPDDIA